MPAQDPLPSSPALTPRLLWGQRHAEDLSQLEYWRPTAQLYPSGATFRDRLQVVTASIALPGTGVALLTGGVLLEPGVPINGIRCATGGTASITLTHSWAFLADQTAVNANVIAKTSDNLTAEWTANTVRDFTFAAPFVPSSVQAAYIGLVVVAATMPTVRGTSPTALFPNSEAPIFAGDSTAGLSDPASLGATCLAPTAANRALWAYLI